MKVKEESHRTRQSVRGLAVVVERLDEHALMTCRTRGVYIEAKAEGKVKARTQASTACRKRRFRDIEQAKRALGRSRVSRRMAEVDGFSTNRRECRYYWCAPCAGYHLTSKPERIAVDYATSA